MRWLAVLCLCSCGEGGFEDDPATDCNEANEGCGPVDCDGEGERMLPGSDCLGCHNAEDADDTELVFNLAGTVFADDDGTAPLPGARIVITDDEDQRITLSSNDAGNFWSRRSLVFPADVEIEVGEEVASMPAPLQQGSCNACHACDGEAESKLHGP